LGGYAILPRLLDKCRAHLAGTPGEYHFCCPLDQEFFDFTGIDPELLKAEVARGTGDAGLLAWVNAKAPTRHTPWEIEQWSKYQEERKPELHSEGFEYFLQTSAAISKERGDIHAWFDLLDLDDYASYGGTV
jgi:hypothetical protein